MPKHSFVRQSCLLIAGIALASVYGNTAAHRPANLSTLAAVEISIKEWGVPTSGSHPHDPAVAPDGAAWYTGQASNTLGRLDPLTGKVTEFPLPTPGSGPHGLVADREGAIWYTGNTVGLIGKLDPKTGKVTEYRMPNSRARDPHTPIFDEQGMLWFTVQNGNFVGRLNPATGEIRLVESKTANSRPYGIVVNSKGVPFFDLFGTNKIGSINPATLEITEYTLPAGARPRRIAVTADDVVWYTDYARGFLGRLEPETGKVVEFASPAGQRSEPYGVTNTSDGVIWYSESGVEPNTIVRFNPADASFQSWPIPSGGGVVRHMVSAANNDVWIACSGVDQIGRVSVNLPVASVSAASFAQGSVAADSIVAAFGTRLATATQAATTLPLPTELANTKVSVRDSAGTVRAAPLFFVSPAQVNYLMPAGTASGTASVTISSGDGRAATGTVQIAVVAPGLFAANADGRGVAAANVLRIKADDSQIYESPAAVFDAAQNRFVARAIDLGPESDRVFLILFGGGFRFRMALSAVTVKIGGMDATVGFAGAQGELAGLDQVNVQLPRGLAGRGEVDVVLSVDGRTANTVTVKVN
ncbi:MAG: virginiamycin B lyase family protein [Blastocatellia bacterium]